MTGRISVAASGELFTLQELDITSLDAISEALDAVFESEVEKANMDRTHVCPPNATDTIFRHGLLQKCDSFNGDRLNKMRLTA